MTYAIRPLTPQDFQGVIDIANSLPEWFDEDARRRAIPVDVRFQDGFIALMGERVAGFILLYISEGRVNISWLGVLAEFHRQGIGRDLVKAAENYCREIDISELATYTLGDSVDYEPYEATRAFYASQGFNVYQRSSTDNPGCPEEIKLKKTVPDQ